VGKFRRAKLLALEGLGLVDVTPVALVAALSFRFGIVAWDGRVGQ
jgi:hypothetical protein